MKKTLTVLLLLVVATTAEAQVTRSFTEPFEQIEVSAAELGIVEEVAVKVGDNVSAGQLLGQLNSGVLRESRRLAEHRAKSTARLDAARADMELKQKMLTNLDPLLKSGHANPTEVDRSKTEFEQARAAVDVATEESIEAKIELSKIEAQILRRQIRSPIDGIVVDLHRKPGEFLPSSEPQFATVVDISKIRARFFVGTSYGESLRAGDHVAVLIGSSQVKATATIEFVSPITDSESGTVRIDLIVDNEDGSFRSGVVCVLVDARATRLSSRPTIRPSIQSAISPTIHPTIRPMIRSIVIPSREQ